MLESKMVVQLPDQAVRLRSDQALLGCMCSSSSARLYAITSISSAVSAVGLRLMDRSADLRSGSGCRRMRTPAAAFKARFRED